MMSPQATTRLNSPAIGRRAKLQHRRDDSQADPGWKNEILPRDKPKTCFSCFNLASMNELERNN